VKQFFNILIVLVLTVFSTQNLVANDGFLLTKKSSASVEDINNAGGGLNDILISKLTRSEKLSQAESIIKGNTKEHAIIIDKDGNLLGYKLGEADKVSIAEYYGKIDEGATFTHNHPKNGTFSDEDILAFSDFKFREYRAVTDGKVYVMKSEVPVKINKLELINIKTKIQVELRAKYLDEFTSLSGEAKQKLNIKINEELNEGILNHFNVQFKIE